MRYSSETIYRIHNDDTGEVIEIRPDMDGLGLVELLSKGSHNGKVEARVVFCPSAIQDIIHALESVRKDLSNE